MKKLTKMNMYILLSSLIIEFLLLIYFLIVLIGISIFNNIYAFLRIIIIALGLDLIFIFYLLDLENNQKKPKNILNIYKKDVNYRLFISYPFLIIIKAISEFLLINTYISSYNQKIYIIFEIFSLIIFYILYFIFPKNENKILKIIKLKLILKGKRNTFDFIVINNNAISSTLEINEKVDYNISKKNFYIKDKEIEELAKKYKNIKDLVSKNMVMVVNDKSHKNDNDDYLDTYNKYKNKVIYCLILTKVKVNIPKTKYIKSLKLISSNDNIFEYIENLLTIDKLNYISYYKYKNALRKIKHRVDKKDLLIISKYYFQNKIKLEHNNLPNDNFLLEIYKNAYYTDSYYQSILMLLNYIGALSKMVLFYLYASNSKEYDENKIKRNIALDIMTSWSENIYKLVNKDDLIYNNIKYKKIPLTNTEKVFIKYMSNFLGIEIEGDSVTFLGLFQLIILLRNKVEAHGSINANNDCIIWYLFNMFVGMLQEFLMVNDLHYERVNNKIKVWYKDSPKVSLGEYIIFINNNLCYIFPKERDTRGENIYLEDEEKNYINYFNGNQEYKPYVIEKK